MNNLVKSTQDKKKEPHINRSPIRFAAVVFLSKCCRMTTQSQSEVTLSIRLIRSFEHRNLRFFPLHAVDLSWTTEKLMTVINERISTSTSLPPPFRKFEFDTLKVRNGILKPNHTVISQNFNIKEKALSDFAFQSF